MSKVDWMPWMLSNSHARFKGNEKEKDNIKSILNYLVHAFDQHPVFQNKWIEKVSKKKTPNLKPYNKVYVVIITIADPHKVNFSTKQNKNLWEAFGEFKSSDDRKNRPDGVLRSITLLYSVFNVLTKTEKSIKKVYRLEEFLNLPMVHHSKNESVLKATSLEHWIQNNHYILCTIKLTSKPEDEGTKKHLSLLCYSFTFKKDGTIEAYGQIGKNKKEPYTGTWKQLKDDIRFRNIIELDISRFIDSVSNNPQKKSIYIHASDPESEFLEGYMVSIMPDQIFNNALLLWKTEDRKFADHKPYYINSKEFNNKFYNRRYKYYDQTKAIANYFRATPQNWNQTSIKSLLTTEDLLTFSDRRNRFTIPNRYEVYLGAAITGLKNKSNETKEIHLNFIKRIESILTENEIFAEEEIYSPATKGVEDIDGQIIDFESIDGYNIAYEMFAMCRCHMVVLLDPKIISFAREQLSWIYSQLFQEEKRTVVIIDKRIEVKPFKYDRELLKTKRIHVIPIDGDDLSEAIEIVKHNVKAMRMVFKKDNDHF